MDTKGRKQQENTAMEPAILSGRGRSRVLVRNKERPTFQEVLSASPPSNVAQGGGGELLTGRVSEAQETCWTPQMENEVLEVGF